MADKEIIFLPYQDAAKLVAAIQEEEDIHNEDKRILTVYNQEDEEICWFDFEEVMNEVGDVPAGDRKTAVHGYVLNHIPAWAVDL
jgi:hypothetical protein